MEVTRYKSKQQIGRKLRTAFNYYGINEIDIGRGLQYIKEIAKKRFRELAPTLHPDTARYTGNRYGVKGTGFNLAKSYLERILELKKIPNKLEDVENEIRFMELNKEYKTIERRMFYSFEELGVEL